MVQQMLDLPDCLLRPCSGLTTHGAGEANISRCGLLDDRQGLRKVKLSSWPSQFWRFSDALEMSFCVKDITAILFNTATPGPYGRDPHSLCGHGYTGFQEV